MFPGVNGFHWTAGHLIFLGVFYSVVVVIAATLVRSLLRSRKDFDTGKAEAIRWREDFSDLPARDRKCRHELAGEVAERLCDNAFDCRTCLMHPEFERARATRAIKPALREGALGFPLPLDRFYHRGHTWVKPQPDGTLLIGLDELGKRMMGAPDRMELPTPGTRIRTNGTAWLAGRNGARLRVLSPIDGTVLDARVPDEPLLKAWNDAWILRVRPDSGNPNLKHLLYGNEVSAWMMKELERLQLLRSSARSAPTLADGGVPVADFAATLDKREWDALCGEMFLEP
jgi:glycine cleavage system H lipoate-binding protein